MADQYLALASRMPGQTTLVLVDSDTDTGYHLLASPEWSTPTWDTRYSGMRGTQGAKPAGATPMNRGLALPIRVGGGTTDLMLALDGALNRKADEVRRFGGVLTWRPQGATYRVHFDAMAGVCNVAAWTHRAQHSGILDVILELVTAPYALGDPYDFFDSFSTDTSANYTVDLDEGPALAYQGGQLVPQDIGDVRWRRTLEGYEFSDVQMTMRVSTGSDITDWRTYLFARADNSGSEDFVYAKIDEVGINVGLMIGGNETSAVSDAHGVTTLSTYYVRLRLERHLAVAELFEAEPSPMSAPDATCEIQLAADEAARFHRGHVGFAANVVDLAERYDSLTCEPYTYRNAVLPDVFRLQGEIPGDAPALMDLTVTPSGGSAAPVFALVGWWPRSPSWNYVTNGGFEVDDDGWGVAAVTGITGAATSIDRITTTARVKYGAGAGEIVTPANANRGASFQMFRRFHQGHRYLAMLWASAASATTNTRLILGVNGDNTAESAAALTTTPTLRTVIWEPAADTESAYLAFETTAATATTMAVDGVLVTEAVETALSTAISSGSDTEMELFVVPNGLPALPVLALIESELVVIDALDVETGTATIARGVEGTTPTSHAQDTAVFILPDSAPQREGKGAPPACGIIEGEACDPGNLYTFALAANSGGRGGAVIETGALTGAGSASADWLVDPNVLAPDDYTEGELAVEVYARVGCNSGTVLPRVILAAAPETATVSSGVMSSSWGGIRYSDEHGSAGRSIVAPSTTGAFFRFVKCGTLRMTVDRVRPQRMRMQVRFTWESGTATGYLSIDYLVLVPAAARAISPTAKPLDANYPRFCVSTSETIKTVAADLSGVVQKPGSPPSYDHGLGGSLLELPAPGQVDVLVKLSSLAADDPTTDTSTEQEEHAASVHVGVTPRFALARGTE